MALRLRSLKTRTALAMSSVIVVILVFNAFYLILTKRKELREAIDQRSLSFALLTRAPICAGYETYYASGFYKFRELMHDLLDMNPDVERILIINVNGQILFDSTELEEAGGPRIGEPPARWVQEPERLEAVKRLEYTRLERRGEDGERMLEIIAPYLEDWGRHKLSVAYEVSYKNLRPHIQDLLWTTAGLTLLSIGFSVIVAVALATRITKPLSELTGGAKHIAEGHFDRRLDIRSNDELQILAETFNHMTERLKENVEQLEESNKKLAAVNEELKELDRMKSDLLANVSHELRTPLTAIKGYTDYILERKLGAVTEKQEKGLVVVQRNLERLSKSINALLDFSRMEMGGLVLNIQPFGLTALVEHIHVTVRSELDRKRIEFVIGVEEDLPPVIADREKISAVLENLVINAIKFTPEGGRIEVTAVHSAVGLKPEAEIRVEDTGIGIPADQLGRIFQRFHQVDGSSTRRFGGVGLGLAIVRSILEAHGSRVQVESQEGHGTSFRFHLPLVERAESAAAPEKTPARVRRTDEALVLVLDDEPDMTRALRGHLEDKGFNVISAPTAAEGAALALERRPDVILLDLLLPAGSGIELLQSLKRDPATRRIPVLVVSMVDENVKVLSLGAAECLLKPVDGPMVVSTVRRLLDGAAAAGVTVLVVDDERDTAKLIQDTLRAEGFRAMVAHDGRQALDLIRHARPGLVILDMMMPDRSGFEVLEALGHDASLAGLPVVMLTARGREAEETRALSRGDGRHLGKPFDGEELIAEVRKHVGTSAPQGRRASL